MIGLDTNCLVRLLLDDPKARAQCERVRATVQKAQKVYISPLVLMESAWVFAACYQLKKEEIAATMKTLLASPNIVWDNKQSIHQAVELFAASNIEFADAMSLCLHRDKKITLLTFDKKLARHKGAQAA
ncbi:MAG: PIN domain-containing protein [Gammaproteobacteria bacterium]